MSEQTRSGHTHDERDSDQRDSDPRARILIFTGDGKGKTTAALGMALRAAGHRMPVRIVQFVKNDATVGEYKLLAAAAFTQMPPAVMPTVMISQHGLGFIPKRDNPRFASHQQAAADAMQVAREALASRRFKLVILDEICVAVATGLLAEADVLSLVGAASPESCLVLTGRGATAALVAAADTVTEMRCVKHGYQSGIAAQQGVEM